MPNVNVNVIELSESDTALRALLTGVQAEQRRSAVEALGADRTPASLMAVVDDAYARFDRELKRIPPQKLVCKPGCAWCCHGLVQTDAPGALRIVGHLRVTLRPEQLAAVKKQVARLDDRTRALQVDSSAAGRLTCALLVNNRCSIYPVRPLACRGWNSSDANRCREDLLGTLRGSVPVHKLQVALQAAVGAGLEEGLREVGLRTDVLALIPALRIAFETRSAAERWLAGEACFGPARVG